MQEQAFKMEQSMRACEKFARDQAKATEVSVQHQKMSYADTVKGTCSKVAKVVKSQLDSLPKVNVANDRKAAKELSQALNDPMNKERRKSNLVVHNLPEQTGDSVAERSEKDVACFMTMIKDVMRLHVTSSRSFRVGKKHPNKQRLVSVTLDNMTSKHDILRSAPQLQNFEEYGNVYITPDLTQKEREVNRKLREELTARRKAGEANLTIKGGKIVKVAAHDRAGRDSGSRNGESVTLAEAAALPAPVLTGPDPHASAVLGSGGRAQHRPQSAAGVGQGDSDPAVLGSGSRAQHRPQSATGAGQGDSDPAVLGSGSRAQHRPQSATGAGQGDSAPAVLGSGSRAQHRPR